MINKPRAVAALFATTILAACSNGGGSSLTGSTQAFQSAKVSFTIFKPSKKSHALQRYERVHPNFVSPNAGSITFTLTAVNGGAPPSGFNSTVVVQLSGGSQNCTAATGGLQCTATATAPVATDTWTVSTYQNATGTGNLLSSSSISQAIAAGANTIRLTLNPIVNSLAWSTSAVTAGNGTAVGNAVELEALDASGAIIVPVATGATQYQIPLYLQSDGITIDYIGYTCQTNLGFYTSSAHTTAAQGAGASLSDGTSISSPDSTQTGTNQVTDPAGATVTAVGNNGTYIYYDGTAQTGATGSLTCSATDSAAHTATFTLTLQNGSIGWIVD